MKNLLIGLFPGGVVLDVNSLYPSVMYYEKLPYDEGIYFEGEYEKDELYNLFIQRFTCQFEIKPDHIPTIQIKNHAEKFIPTEYLKSSRGRDGVLYEVELCLTSVDLELFLDHYEVYNLTYIDGYKFKSTDKMFKKYIDKWINEKNRAKDEGNSSMYAIAKLMLNNIYGKFALNPEVRSKIPKYDKVNDKICYAYGEMEHRDPIYIPCASFITAWARNKTIRSAQKVYSRFIYADTDSLHLEGFDIPVDLVIDSKKLGAWDYEFKFYKGKYLRQKCYMEYGHRPAKEGKVNLEKKKLKITCAGMPKSCYQQVNFENFKIGACYEGKLQTTRTSGGIVLTPGNFTIKENLFTRF